MDNERETSAGSSLARWAVVAMLIVAGVALYFGYGRRTPAVIEPSIGEAAP